jgi:hypothetical protein
MPSSGIIGELINKLVAFGMSLGENPRSSRRLSSPRPDAEHTPSSDSLPSQGLSLAKRQTTASVIEPPPCTDDKLSLVTTSPDKSISQALTPLPCVGISNVSHELNPSIPVSLGLAATEAITAKEAQPPTPDDNSLGVASPVFNRDNSTSGLVRPETPKHDRSTLQRRIPDDGWSNRNNQTDITGNSSGNYIQIFGSYNTAYISAPKGKFSLASYLIFQIPY